MIESKRFVLDFVDLSEASLQGANLEHATLRGADPFGVDLQKANLVYADLEKANLTYANLGGADLKGAIFKGATLIEDRGLTFKRLSQVKMLFKASLDPNLENRIKEKCPHLLEEPCAPGK